MKTTNNLTTHREKEEKNMKKLLMSLGVAAMVAGATLPMSAQAAAPVAEVKRQPHMKAALAALQQAKEELKKAKHNKGGHRFDRTPAGGPF
mgnify:CR=1 FL=1